MKVEFKLPELGENIDSGDVVRILVSIGDTIEKDQPVVEIETDKAAVEVPSDVSGKIVEIHVEEGQAAQVGAPVVTVETDASAQASTSEPAKTNAPAKEEPKAPSKIPQAPLRDASATASSKNAQVIDLKTGQTQPNRDPNAPAPAAPSTRRFARELGVDIKQVPGTNQGGRISERDVKDHVYHRMTRPGTGVVSGGDLPDFTKWGEVERKPMSNVRKRTAENMAVSWNSIPHVTHFDKADITTFQDLRKKVGPQVEKRGGKLTITALALKVAAIALKKFPQFNASIDMATHEVIYKNYFHIGVAVDTERGLLVPVIRDVDKKNMLELCVELTDIANRARDKKIKPDELQGGTFTITNLGGLGGTNFTPIIRHPEVAILALSRGGKEPVFDGTKFVPRMTMPIGISYDHRIIDGADAARFTRFLAETLEQPFAMAFDE